MSGSSEAGAFSLPVGTVAFLLTEVEGSTRAGDLEPEAMAAAMERHRAILDAAVSSHGGVCPPGQGEDDSFVAAFARPSDAVLAAGDAQRALVAEPWPTADPLRVRMAVHAGESRLIDDRNYAGQAIVRTARLRAIAHGGQVLVSAPARDVTIDHLGDDVELRDLGEHRLRDLARPERVYQLEGPGLPDGFEPLRSLDAHPHNLPVQLSTFIGRSHEIATVTSLLTANRLVTITGAGGAGKTRVAQHVAAEVVERFGDGVWWVELAEVNDPTSVPATISTAVGLKGEVGEGAVVALAERLGRRQLLLVLDNCEHLIEAVADLVDQVLRQCPGVAVLATSRESLDVAGEVAWRIPPLGIPTESGHTPIVALPQFDSVRLFVDRARAVRPNFHLTDDNGPSVAEICTRLDGIPLAIELAAARCRSLSPARILGGLTDVFRLLTSGRRTALPRQQTLEASIGWSHDLLTIDEQVLLRRLAVFNGGCTLDDAELVVADDRLESGAVLDLLDRLVAQSLVHLDDHRAVARYRLLETVRQYAARRLDETDEGDRFRARHADRFVELADEIGVACEGHDDSAAAARAVAEHDNFVTALESLATTERWDDYTRLAIGLGWVRLVTEPLQSTGDLSIALEHTSGDSPVAARLLAFRAAARGNNLDVIGAIDDANECTRLAGALGDERSVGRAQLILGYLLCYVDPDAADRVLAEAIEHATTAGDTFTDVWAAEILAGSSVIFRGEMATGWERMDRAQAKVDDLGNSFLTMVLDSLVAVGLCGQSRYAEASARLERAEDGIAQLAGATRLSADYLLRNTVAGAFILFARTWHRYAQELPVDLDEIASVIATARTEGQYFVAIAVGLAGGMARYAAGDPDGARADLEAVADQAATVGAGTFFAMASMCVAVLRDEAGDADGARQLLIATEATSEACGNQFNHAQFHCAAGGFAVDDGQLGEAERRAHECLSLARRHEYGFEAALGLELVGQVAAATSSPVEAVRMMAAAARIRDERSARFCFTSHRDRRDAGLAACRDALGDERYETAWAEGSALSLDEAVEHAQRARGQRKRPSLGWDSLTPTELLVVGHVEAGLTNPQIAEKLLISRDTVKTHLSHIFTKLRVTSRSELAAIAARRALATEDHP